MTFSEDILITAEILKSLQMYLMWGAVCQIGENLRWMFNVLSRVYLQVLSEPTHTLQNKVIDPKRAQTRGATEVCRKIFVGGLDPNLPEESIREYFGQFGKVRYL